MATSEKRKFERGIWSRRDFFGRLGWLGSGFFKSGLNFERPGSS